MSNRCENDEALQVDYNELHKRQHLFRQLLKSAVSNSNASNTAQLLFYSTGSFYWCLVSSYKVGFTTEFNST